MRALFILLILMISIPCYADFRVTEDDFDSTNPCVGVGPDQLARIAWSSQQNGTYQICWATFDPSGTQTLPTVVLTASVEDSSYPRLSVDDANRSFLVWEEGGQILFARIGPDGTVDVSPKQINDQLGTCSTPDIDTTPEGISHVVYQLDQSIHKVGYRVLNENGDDINPPLTLGNCDFIGIEKYPAVGLDPDGNAYIAWNDICNFDQGLNYVIYSAAGTVLWGPSLIVTGNGITRSATLPTRPYWAWVIYQDAHTGTSNIYDYRGSGPGDLISGQAQRPRMAGADELPIYGVWQQFNDGIWKIVARKWDNDSNILPGDILISDGDANATMPDIDTDGNGQYYVVWRDMRNENAEIYMDAVKPIVIEVTAQVRAEHDDGLFMDPYPVLSGVTARIDDGGIEREAVADENGIAQFAVDRSSVAQSILRLSGPHYHIKVDNGQWGLPNYDPIEVTALISSESDTTHYLWPHAYDLQKGTALQAAYFLEKFRKEFWLDRFNYEWNLPVLSEQPENTMGVTIYQWNEGVYNSGGAYVDPVTYQELHFFRHRCEEADVLYHEYTHSVICERFGVLTDFVRPIGIPSPTDEGGAMDEALADYFAASFTNDPIIARCADPLWYPTSLPWCIPFRDLAEGMSYPSGEFGYDRYEGSVILSGALWDLRALIDGEGAPEATVTDSLVFMAIDSLIVAKAVADPSAIYTMPDFFDALTSVDEGVFDGRYANEIELAFLYHNLPNPTSYQPLMWPDGNGIIRVDELGGNIIEIEWLPLTDAMYYEVLVNTIDYDPQTPSLGTFYELATGLTDNLFVFDARDSTTSYLFSVVAVDDTGQPGYMALPVFVEEIEDLTVSGVPETLPIYVKKGRWLFNSPNPFNPMTWINFEMFFEDAVEVNIFDISGRRIRTITKRNFQAGTHRIPWDGLDADGHRLAAGLYLIRLRGTTWMDHGKVLLLK